MTLLWTYKFHLAVGFIIISSTPPFPPLGISDRSPKLFSGYMMIVRRTCATMLLFCHCQRHDVIYFNIDLVASKVRKQVLSRGAL